MTTRIKFSNILWVLISTFILSTFIIPIESAIIPADKSEDPPITDILYLDIHQKLGDSDANESKLLGTIEIGLFGTVVPKTVKNFEGLATTYEKTHTLFHRIIPGFVIQAGDIDGLGGHSIFGKKGHSPPADANPKDFGPYYSGLEDENFELSHSKAGRVSVANSGPNTGGSQFFICLEPQLGLDGKHVVFGQVINGMEISETIASVDRDSNDKPINDVFIYKARVETAKSIKQTSDKDAVKITETNDSKDDAVYEDEFKKEKAAEGLASDKNTDVDKEYEKIDKQTNTDLKNKKVATDSAAYFKEEEKLEAEELEAEYEYEESQIKVGEAKDTKDAKGDKLYADDHPTGFGGSTHHYVIIPFLIFAGVAGFMGFKNRRSLVAMVRGPRYRRI